MSLLISRFRGTTVHKYCGQVAGVRGSPCSAVYCTLLYYCTTGSSTIVSYDHMCTPYVAIEKTSTPYYYRPIVNRTTVLRRYAIAQCVQYLYTDAPMSFPSLISRSACTESQTTVGRVPGVSFRLYIACVSLLLRFCYTVSDIR